VPSTSEKFPLSLFPPAKFGSSVSNGVIIHEGTK